MQKFLFTTLFLLLLAVPNFSYAQEDNSSSAILPEKEKIETGAVKVTASKVEKELLDVPASVSIITEEDIKKSSARTIGELLEDIPGIQTINSGGQGLKRVSIRGEGANRTLILIDGQQIVENKSMDGTAILIDPSMVERIEVIRGPASVLYGSNAIGGVINIITKKGGDKPIQGTLATSYNGASSGLAESLSLYGSAAGVDYRVSASYNDQKQLRTPIGLVPNSAFNQQNYSAYLAYNFAKHFKVGASYDYFDADIMSGSQSEGYDNFYVDMPIWSRQKAAAFFEMKEIASFMPKLRFDLFFQESHKYMNNHVDIDQSVVAMPSIMDNIADNYNTQWGLQLQTDWAIGKHTYIIFGYEFNYNILDAITDVISTPYDTENVTMMDYLKHSEFYGYEYSNALYAQAEHYLPVDFTLSYGIRWTHYYTNLEKAVGTQTYYSYTPTGDDVTINADGSATIPVSSDDLGSTGETWNQAPVGAIGLMWSGIENFTARINWSQGFRSPSIQEKYIYSGMGGGSIYPNPDLEPETSNNFEVGLRYSDYGVSVDAVYFVSIADNYIAQVSTAVGRNETRYRNISSVFSHGAELQLGYNTPINLKPYINLTIMMRRYEDTDISATWNTGVPLVRGRGGLLYTHTFNNAIDFTIDLFSRFASDTYDILDTVHQEFSDTGLHYDAWGTLNLAIGVAFGDRRQYSLTGEVWNITNELYRTSVDIWEPGLYGAIKFAAEF